MGEETHSRVSNRKEILLSQKVFLPQIFRGGRSTIESIVCLLLLVRPLLLAIARVIINVPFSRLTFCLKLHSFSSVFTFLIIHAMFAEKVRKKYSLYLNKSFRKRKSKGKKAREKALKE